MDYGYDAQGNRVPPPASAADHPRNEEALGRARADASGVADTADDARTPASAASSPPSGADDSDFSDSVELVIGETGNQSIAQPLVESAAYNLRGKNRLETEAFLQLEAGSAAHGNASSPAMRIADRARAAPASESSFLETVAKVPARLSTLALVGSLHHGKTALLNMLLGGHTDPPRPDEAAREVTLQTHVVSALLHGARLHPTSRLVTLVDTPGHADFLGETAAGVRLADAVLFCVDALESLDSAGERLLRQVTLSECLPIVLVLTKVDRLILELKLPPLDAYRKLRTTVDTVNNVIASCGAGAERARYLVAPENGTVLFSSATMGFIFSLDTFALKYAEARGTGEALDHAALAQRLWGQITFENGVFQKITGLRQRPSFVTFVLEPLYKIVAHAVSGSGAETLSAHLSPTPRSPQKAIQEAISLFLGSSPGAEGLDALFDVLPTPAERAAHLAQQYGLQQEPSAASAVSGAPPVFTLLEDAAQDAVSVAAIAPLVAAFTATAEVAGGATNKAHRSHRTAVILRVLKGVLHGGQGVSSQRGRASGSPRGSPLVVVDELSDDVTPFTVAHVAKLLVRMPERGFVEVERAYSGQVVYATFTEDGVPSTSTTDGTAAASEEEEQQQQHRSTAKGEGLPGGQGESAALSGTHMVFLGGPAATVLLMEDGQGELASGAPSLSGVEHWLQRVRPWPLSLAHHALVHVSLELKDPAALPSFQRGLELLRRTTPGLDLRTEESGDYTMTGYGELQLDTALHLLRTRYCAGVKLGLSAPFASLSETVLDGEGVLAVAGTRRKGMFGCTSGALPKSLTHAIEYEQLNFAPAGSAETVMLWTTLRKEHALDALDARHVLALGPDATKGPSLLLDDTLVEEAEATAAAPPARVDEIVDFAPALPQRMRGPVVAGFRDAMRSGPLVGEVVRGVAVRLILADAATEKAVRVAETRANVRLAVRQALYGARPRLLEPVLAADILCPPECLAQLTSILQQRRGAVTGEEPIAATTLTRVRAMVPAMDSFGLETQIRMHTSGQAFPMFSFAQWDVVPGDPYDAAIHVAPMEPAKGYQLARDFALKTRFRKGLPPELTADI